MKKPPVIKKNVSEAGIVSIMVTLILMMVITLIVLGFAQVSRREQRQSLDRQLSAQAFFAAESGVNDARKGLTDALQNPLLDKEKTDCATSSTSPAPYNFDSNIDAANNVAYTCMLVSTKLDNIQQTIEADGKSVTIPINTGSTDVRSLEIVWAVPTSGNNISTCQSGSSIPSVGSLPKANAWTCPYGVLRMEVQNTAAGQLTRTALNANQRTAFFYPVSASTGSINYAAMKGAVAPISCNASTCRTVITDLNGTSFSLRLSALYKGGTFTIRALDNGDNPIMLDGVQAQVDVTGKAQDVLRRIQVRFSLIPGIGSDRAEYAIASASSLCKRFEVIRSTNTFRIPGDIVNQDENNPMCKSTSSGPPPPPPPLICPNTVSFDFGLQVGTWQPYHLTGQPWYDSVTGVIIAPPKLTYSLFADKVPDLVNINAGCRYAVTIGGYDDSHPHIPPSEQPNERFAAAFYDGGISVAPRTDMTDDWPDAYKVGPKKTTNICFSGTPDEIRFQHHNLVTGDYSDTNSVQVLDIEMQLIGTCVP